MKTTKKLLTLLLAMCLLGGMAAQAQEGTERSISIEALGVHNIVGVNFDSRFKGNHGFGYRVGVGYTQGTHALGLGTSLGYYGERIEFPTIGGHQYMPVTNRGFGYFVFGNIGYRLQTKSGLMIRTGWAPSINFDDGGTHYLHRRLLTSLYISVGWRL